MLDRKAKLLIKEWEEKDKASSKRANDNRKRRYLPPQGYTHKESASRYHRRSKQRGEACTGEQDWQRPKRHLLQCIPYPSEGLAVFAEGGVGKSALAALIDSLQSLLSFGIFGGTVL